MRGEAGSINNNSQREENQDIKTFSTIEFSSQPPICLGRFHPRSKRCKQCGCIEICRFVKENFVPKADLLPILHSLEKIELISKGFQ